MLVVFVLAWSVYELYPPVGQPVIDFFKQRAVNRDATYESIVQRAEELRQEFPDRDFGNLKEAVGTNAIAQYFPFINTEGELNASTYVLHRLQNLAAGKIKLGIDLQGGTSFLLRMDTNDFEIVEQKQAALNEAVEVLRKRVDRIGVAEPVIQPSGSDRILIQLPGLTQEEMNQAKTNISKAAFLEFRMVHPRSDENLSKGIVPPGYEMKSMQRTMQDGSKALSRYLVKREPERGLTGKYVERAMMARDPITNTPEIHFELDGEGAQLFAEITREYSPTPDQEYMIAIILDGELYSAPRINEPILNGNVSITGDFTAREAFELANVLENPLSAPLEIIQESTVDPSLGEDSINSGVRAAIYGIIAVAVFMIVYYLLAGLVANVALLLNMVILLGVFCSLEATMTLPGIAGIVLTIGMAVDANVLIFERIREELRAGKSLKGAIQAGYSKAFSTILDSNITTFISAIILYKMGTGPVQGFGITLAIGIGTSMFTALVATRLIFDFLVQAGTIKNIAMLSVFGHTKIDFLQWAKPAFIATWILILASMSYGVFVRGGDVMGVDFSGGDSVRLDFQQKVDVDQLRTALADLKTGSPQYQQNLGTGEENLLLTTEFGVGPQAVQALQNAFPEAGFNTIGIETVGPVIGGEILRTAVIAMLLALFGILVYVAFRFELSFSVGAIVAILHDVLMTLGIFFVSGRELSAPMVAAILTIIGFSINDTIVIFDRIREDLKLGVRGSFKDVINIAINQTLSRTLITSGTTFLSALALYIFGGGVINDFAFTFLVGILTGTYSTIYIATALVLWWHKGERPRATTQVIMNEPATADV